MAYLKSPEKDEDSLVGFAYLLVARLRVRPAQCGSTFAETNSRRTLSSYLSAC